MFSGKKALLLDMNSTFMFGEDRFGPAEDYSVYYDTTGGELSKFTVNQIINQVLDYLEPLYPNEKYRNNFPSVEDAVRRIPDLRLTDYEVRNLIQTFSYHEHGHIPVEYAEVLFKLNDLFKLAVVIDIWAPKERWVNTFEKLGIDKLFSASSFSSDHGTVKPSAKPFEIVIKQLGLPKEQCLFIGDSVRRDLGGAKATGIDCVLVGGASHEDALMSYPNLLTFYDELT